MRHEIVDHEQWLEARTSLLSREKEFNRLRDELSQARRDLPWERVEKNYVFETRDGPRGLLELFEGRRQLVVYHFMFGADWDEGCPSCSWWADNFDPNILHLQHRDITMVAVSRCPLEKLTQYQQRYGWEFNWASSLNNDFGRDFFVSYEKAELAKSYHNYQYQSLPCTELPGVSIFFCEDDQLFHTYSTYARGLDMLNAGYHIMDLTPLGRAENNKGPGMSWLRRRDQY